MQAQDPAGECVSLLLLWRLCEIHIYSHQQQRRFIANIQTSQVMRRGWILGCTTQWQARGKGGWIPEAIQKLKTYRVDGSAFIPGKNYFNLCF